MNCPRCETELRSMTFPGVGNATIHMCPNCEGAWYPSYALCQVTDLGRDAIASTNLAPALVADQLEKIDLDAPVKCPECQEEMHRSSYRLAPEIQLDECPEHGMWLDDGELGVVLEQIATAQANEEQSRREIAAKREEMGIDAIAKGEGSLNPFALTLRALNSLFMKKS